MASEQPDRKVPKENTTAAAFIYFSIFLIVVEHWLAQAANEVGKFFQEDWCSCDYLKNNLGMRDFWDSRRQQCHVTHMFSHLSRLQKETLHLKEAIGPPVWDNALNCLAAEGKFLNQPSYTF